MNRRQYLATVSTSVVAVLAGCQTNNEANTTTNTTTPTQTTTGSPKFDVIDVRGPESVEIGEPFEIEIEIENTENVSGTYEGELLYSNGPGPKPELDEFHTASISQKIPAQESEIWIFEADPREIPIVHYYRVQDGNSTLTHTVERPDSKAPIIEETNVVSEWEDYGDVVDNAIDEVTVGDWLSVASRYWYWLENQTNNTYKQVEVYDDSGNRVAIDSYESEQLTDYNGWGQWESYLQINTEGWEPGTYIAEMLIRDDQNGKVSNVGKTLFN